METSHPEESDKGDVPNVHQNDIPLYCFTNQEVAAVLGTTVQTLNRNIKGIRPKLGRFFLKWNIDQVVMIVEHWGTAPEKGQTDAEK